MAGALWTPLAVDDLAEIASYIAVKDARPLVSEKIVREIHEKAEQYAKHPSLGIKRFDLAQGLYCFRHKRWLVFYEIVDGQLKVLRVLDGSRDYPKLFAAGS